MLLPKIIYRKYNLNGFNNPTDFFVGVKKNIDKRKKDVKRIYFIDAPEHSNMGDQAIACAMVNFLEKYQDYEVLTFPISHLLENIVPIKKDCKKEDIIVLIGGGNMGVEYFANEEARRVVIEAFPNNRIVIFPQTIDYGKTETGKKEFENAVNLYSRHKDLHIFAREEASYKIMKKNFNKNYVELTPDIVLSMEYSNKYERNGILQCIRRDRESALSKEEYIYIVNSLKLYGNVRKIDTVDVSVPIITSEDIRKKLVYRKLSEFARAEFVVTDRLHGMIFSAITNTPCFVLPTYNHKVVSCYETWLRDNDNIVFVNDLNKLDSYIESNKKTVNDSEDSFDLSKKYKALEECFER